MVIMKCVKTFVISALHKFLLNFFYKLFFLNEKYQ